MNANAGRPPAGLRSIAVLEAVKGVLAIAAGCGVISLRHTDLHSVIDTFLVRHRINPDTHYRHLFIESFARMTHQHVAQVAGLAFAYGLIRLVEAYGLWNARHWAEWFAVISAGVYLPMEIAHLLRHPTHLTLAITCFNILIVVYLARLLQKQRAERRGRLAAARQEK
ncbi:MAG TPA: DUF2127 domain-containing protein [Candidatus Acidoferrum sp.]|nr:DUF2127 domain-containing protein [Candidatus Acidoferrum sp.]